MSLLGYSHEAFFLRLWGGRSTMDGVLTSHTSGPGFESGPRYFSHRYFIITAQFVGSNETETIQFQIQYLETLQMRCSKGLSKKMRYKWKKKTLDCGISCQGDLTNIRPAFEKRNVFLKCLNNCSGHIFFKETRKFNKKSAMY